MSIVIVVDPRGAEDTFSGCGLRIDGFVKPAAARREEELPKSMPEEKLDEQTPEEKV